MLSNIVTALGAVLVIVCVFGLLGMYPAVGVTGGFLLAAGYATSRETPEVTGGS